MKNYFESAVSIAFMITLITVVGCDKKNDPSPIKKDELTNGSGKWKLTAETVKALGQTEDEYDSYEPCEQDNIYYFKDDGTLQILEGATKCDPADPDIMDSGTWEISGKHFTMDVTSGIPGTADIITLNATTLKCSLKLDLFGTAAVITTTYTKQP